MKHYYCTLFDSFYFYRGLALYESLCRHDKDFHLYIFAFDQLSYDTLLKLSLRSVTVVSLKDFESPDLLKIKPTRTQVEYCWTATPSILFFCLENYNLPHCTYLDADIYFFSDPELIFSELHSSSVLITLHDFSDAYKKYAINGLYNVQFMFFRNDTYGLQVLRHWRDQCIDWCYSRVEKGKFGDQKYLDHWTSEFEGVHVLQNKFAALAPWNIQQYEVKLSGRSLLCQQKIKNQTKAAVFYHFHGFKMYLNGYALMLGYELSSDLIEFVYRPYLQELLQIREKVYQEVLFSKSNGFLKNDEKGFELKALELKMVRGDYSDTNLMIYNQDDYSKVRDRIALEQFIKVPIRGLKRKLKSILNR